MRSHRLWPEHDAAPVLHVEAKDVAVPAGERARILRLEEHAADAENLGHLTFLLKRSKICAPAGVGRGFEAYSLATGRRAARLQSGGAIRATSMIPAVYIVLVIGQTVVLPFVSTVVELLARGGDPVTVGGRWFLFWGVGTRLLVAGLSQSVRPEFTSREILVISAPDARQLVQELGYSNLIVGAIAIVAAALVPAWRVPVAIIGGAFLGLAGLRHVTKRGLGMNERVATWTDLLVASVMVVFVVSSS